MVAAKRLLVVATLLTFAGCVEAPPVPEFPEISFADKPKILLVAGTVVVVDNYLPPGRRPNVEHEFPVRPAAMLARWATDRLAVSGGAATVRFIINDASATETALKTAKGIKGLLKDQQAHRYDLALAVRIEVTEGGYVRGVAEAQANNSRTAVESISLNDREKTYYEMTKAAGRAIDAELEKNIRRFLATYLR